MKPASWFLSWLLPLSMGNALERLEPPAGCYLGVNLGENDTIQQLRGRLGITPAVYVQFFHFPFSPEVRLELEEFLAQVKPTRGIALITLEPFDGLDAVTEQNCQELAALCMAQEAGGIGGIMIRFAHEMNGNWYPWCQQPLAYRAKFRLLAGIIHDQTRRAAMLWAPHNGIGYPFATGPYDAEHGSPDFAELDTNADGRLTAEDDMYEPYYPGDDAVDWAGMTIYHWGADYPWRENELPPTNAFVSILTGTGHQPPIPDFYRRYCAGEGRGKPLAIPETSAFYNPGQPAGPGEFRIKQAWWRQVLDASDEGVPVHLPKLKCVNWFDHYKPEAEAQGDWIDWRISADPVIRESFVQHLRTSRDGAPYFLTATEFAGLGREHWIRADHLPGILPLRGEVPLSFTASSPTDCDLVVDILDNNFQWQGGTRAPMPAGTGSVSLNLTIDGPLIDGEGYRWSAFLTATGSNYLGALAWHEGPGPVARAINPSVRMLGYPPVIDLGASNIVVKVHYASAANDAVVQVNILDNDYSWLAGATLPVARGQGTRDVLLDLPPLASGSYLLECFLSDSPTNWQDVMARAPSHAVQVGASLDFVQALAHPSRLPAGEVLRFLVTYAAVAERDLHVDLLDARTNFVAGTVQRVGRSSGIQELTISVPDAEPGDYLIHSFLTEPGVGWRQALAWGSVRQVALLVPRYHRWVDWRWGAVLDNDLILPELDADGDGASNDDERIAHTNPMDPRDVLRLGISMAAEQVRLSWPAARFRRYQLLQSDRQNLWVPVGEPVSGNGERIEVQLPLRDAMGFYRLGVWEE